MPVASPRPFSEALPQVLPEERFLVVTGKGGVGKSAVSAALGRLLADRGQRVLVVEVDPRENLHQLFGTPPSGGERVQVDGRLALEHLAPRRVVDRVVAERVRLGPLVRRVFSSPIYQHFVDGAPGLKELAVVDHARRLLAEDAVDTVVLDAPATGHGLSLLQAPALVAEAVVGGPFAELAAEIAALVEDPARSGVVVVAQAEEMPVDESLELAENLQERLGRGPELLVVNGLLPAVPGGEVLPEDLLTLWSHRRRSQERELARLAAGWSGPRVEIPLVPRDRGPQLVAALARCLAAAPVLEGAPISSPEDRP